MSITRVPVTLVVGTHTWAPTLASEKEIDEIVTLLRKHKVTLLDTGRSYILLRPFPPVQQPLTHTQGNGASETVIGNKNLAAEFVIGTKAD
jgi:aflatoxin B1 aldehyde reductase